MMVQVRIPAPSFFVPAQVMIPAPSRIVLVQISIKRLARISRSVPFYIQFAGAGEDTCTIVVYFLFSVTI